MFRAIFTTALSAGAIVGIVISLVQAFTTTPLILHAEKYENSAVHTQILLNPYRPAAYAPRGNQSSALVADPWLRVHNNTLSEAEAWAPTAGLERTVYTTLSNILMSIGFAMILVAVFALRGKPVDSRQGVLWGVGGFAVFQLAPALGLPPEVPGTLAADLEARQLWWLLTVTCTAVGLWLMVFGNRSVWPIVGLVVIVVPHLIGAPHSNAIGGSVPPELAGHFAAASLVVGAIFWTLLGWVSGRFYPRLMPR